MEPAPIDRAAVRLAWAQSGYTCELWVDPPNKVWHDFRHEVDERILLLDGEIQVEFQGRTVVLRSGDELLIPAGVRHTVRNSSGRTARWLYGYRAGTTADTGLQH